MANLLIGTLGDLGSAFDALGNDSIGDTLSTVQEVAGGLLNTAQSGATLSLVYLPAIRWLSCKGLRV